MICYSTLIIADREHIQIEVPNDGLVFTGEITSEVTDAVTAYKEGRMTHFELKLVLDVARPKLTMYYLS